MQNFNIHKNRSWRIKPERKNRFMNFQDNQPYPTKR